MSEVEDVLEAVNIATNYLAKKGIVVFTREVRDSIIWSVEIYSDRFIGVIIIKAKTGEVVTEVVL